MITNESQKIIQIQAVRIGTEAVLHFPSISPMCMLRGSVMWKKGRGWHVWLIHKFRTEPAFWKWLIQGDWEEMEGNEVGGPWIKGARKGLCMVSQAFLSFFPFFPLVSTYSISTCLLASSSLWDRSPQQGYCCLSLDMSLARNSRHAHTLTTAPTHASLSCTTAYPIPQPTIFQHEPT